MSQYFLPDAAQIKTLLIYTLFFYHYRSAQQAINDDASTPWKPTPLISNGYISQERIPESSSSSCSFSSCSTFPVSNFSTSPGGILCVYLRKQHQLAQLLSVRWTNDNPLIILLLTDYL